MEAHYYSYKQFLIDRFGESLLKLPIDAGFSCPNRDGTVGTGGCTYCLNNAFVPRYCSSEKDILQQIEDGIEFHRQRGRESRFYLAYFQAFSNTHASLDKLRELYETTLSNPKIKGLIIGTRPDCVDEDKLNYLKTLNHKQFISVEYGIESCYDRTLQRVNRGHDFATAEKAVRMTAERGIHTGAHFIIGLPGETADDWLNGIQLINQMPINSIKFHQLQIIKGTAMEREFQEHPEDFRRLNMEEYIDLMVDIIERLRADIVIERFAAEVPPKYLSSNPWKLQRYDVILQRIRQRLEARDVRQGDLLTPINH
ncbi:MAG: TIGR01212 family radical SAM protein [Bacteroidales bacterium]|nr:TIGR01212 family radical SAM protein [Bacteroidales bacterium]